MFSQLARPIAQLLASGGCDPYAQPGTLAADFGDPDNTRWVPLDPKCSPAPRFLPQLRADPPTLDAQWLYNRTALIVGDAISREHVEALCGLLGEGTRLEVVRPGHPFSPPATAVRGAAQAQHTLDKPARLSSRTNTRWMRDSSLPRICYVPQYDFMVRPAPPPLGGLTKRAALTFARAGGGVEYRLCQCFTMASIRKTFGATRPCLSTALRVSWSTG